MDFHLVTRAGAELLMCTVDGRLVIVPPPALPPASVPTGSAPVLAAPDALRAA